MVIEPKGAVDILVEQGLVIWQAPRDAALERIKDALGPAAWELMEPCVELQEVFKSYFMFTIHHSERLRLWEAHIVWDTERDLFRVDMRRTSWQEPYIDFFTTDSLPEMLFLMRCAYEEEADYRKQRAAEAIKRDAAEAIKRDAAAIKPAWGGLWAMLRKRKCTTR